MNVNIPGFGLGWLIALVVLILAVIFLASGAPSHFTDWVFGLIGLLAVARLVP